MQRTRSSVDSGAEQPPLAGRRSARLVVGLFVLSSGCARGEALDDAAASQGDTSDASTGRIGGTGGAGGQAFGDAVASGGAAASGGAMASGGIRSTPPEASGGVGSSAGGMHANGGAGSGGFAGAGGANRAGAGGDLRAVQRPTTAQAPPVTAEPPLCASGPTVRAKRSLKRWMGRRTPSPSTTTATTPRGRSAARTPLVSAARRHARASAIFRECCGSFRTHRAPRAHSRRAPWRPVSGAGARARSRSG